MAFGDVGGVVTELVITCRTKDTGPVNIARGDAVKLTGNYVIDNVTAGQDPVFGQALAATQDNDAAIPVKVRGICVFPYTGSAPAVNGEQGIVASATPGSVMAPATGNGFGINVKVDAAAGLVHVLL